MARPYLITGGRTLSAGHDLDLTTLVQAGSDAGRTRIDGPERAQIVRLCRKATLSIAEISSRVNLPHSITKIIITELVDTGHLSTRTPADGTARPDKQLLQEILDGLNAL